MSKYDPDALRGEFADLTAKRDAILAVSMPLRDERDAFVQKNSRIEAAMNVEIAKAEEGLHDLHNDIAAIARALGGKTSAPAETDEVKA